LDGLNGIEGDLINTLRTKGAPSSSPPVTEKPAAAKEDTTKPRTASDWDKLLDSKIEKMDKV